MTKEQLEKIQSLAGDMAKPWGTLLSELGIAEEIIEILSAIYGEKK